MSSLKKIYLVDVSSMFFRAFYAIPPLNNDKGMPTNALYGFLTMTVKLLREIRPDYLAFCFDSKEPSFRYEIYSDYKANREEMPENLVPQIPYVKKITEILGIPLIEKSGFEADDLIGTLAHRGRAENLEVVIVSGDKDFAQLVGPLVTMYDTMKEVHYDVAAVKAKWGVRPEQMIDYQALVGDASDNIPGVKGVGPKTAEKLLNEYETLDGIYQHLNQIKGSLHNKLSECRDDAYLSKRLATIDVDAHIDMDLKTLTLKEIQREQLQELLQELNFKTLEKVLLNNSSMAMVPDVKSAKTLKKNFAKSEESTTMRARTTSLEARRGSGAPPLVTVSVLEVSLSLQEFDKLVEPYSSIWCLLTERGVFFGYREQLVKVSAEASEIGRVLQAKHLEWSGYDLKESWKYLHLSQGQAVWDTMLAAYVARASMIENFDQVYDEYCHKKLPDLATPLQIYEAHLEAKTKLERVLHEQHGEKVLQKLELPLIAVLCAMETRGISLDVPELERQKKQLISDLQSLEKRIYQAAGGELFNIGSPKQLAVILFNKLGLQPIKKTKTGFSTDSDVLEKLRSVHPIAELLLEYRELAKLKSTYVDTLPQLVNPQTQRVHTHLNQAATATGRLSSVNPNLQNIPIRTERGREVRKAFVAAPGNVLISADYSQIELRILAHITGDEGLTEAFRKQLDIHAATASEIYGVALSAVTPELRRTAKAVNFGIAYGQGAFGLADTLGISRSEATDIISRYFRRFAKVKEYMEQTVKVATEQGYVETLFGRRRYIEELKSKNQNIRRFGERAAINAPIQGTASDLVKLAMIELHSSLAIPLLLQVHDELIFESPVDQAREAMQEIKNTMETIYQLNVPLVVNIGSGPNWDETK